MQKHVISNDYTMWRHGAYPVSLWAYNLVAQKELSLVHPSKPW